MSQAKGTIFIPVSVGELVDRITILQIKAERITEPQKLSNVRKELDALMRIGSEAIQPGADVRRLTAELRKVNEQLWDVEDKLRSCERTGRFGSGFVKLARSVYRFNDRRFSLKRQISQLLGSGLCEEKEFGVQSNAARSRALSKPPTQPKKPVPGRLADAQPPRTA